MLLSDMWSDFPCLISRLNRCSPGNRGTLSDVPLPSPSLLPSRCSFQCTTQKRSLYIPVRMQQTRRRKRRAQVLPLMVMAMSLDWTAFGVMVDGAEMEAENWRPLSRPQAPGVASPAHSCHTLMCWAEGRREADGSCPQGNMCQKGKLG